MLMNKEKTITVETASLRGKMWANVETVEPSFQEKCEIIYFYVKNATQGQAGWISMLKGA